MKAFRILGRSINESIKSVFRNFSLSLASISCITITLILVGLSIILSFNVNSFTKDIENDLNIVVFLKRNASKEEIDNVEKSINTLNNIKEIKFESRDSIKESMQKDSEVFNSILSNYTDETNPLQDTFLVKVSDINYIGDTANSIQAIESVDIVKYGEGSVEELIKIFNSVKKIAYIIVLGLMLVTAFLITNTIKITIQSRRREIEIRRLVGASNTYIRQPFFFEGIILGLIGSILPVIICCVGYNYIYTKFHGQLFTSIIKLVNPSELTYLLLVVLVITGAIVGAFGSFMSTRKYLKI